MKKNREHVSTNVDPGKQESNNRTQQIQYLTRRDKRDKKILSRI